MREVIYYKDVQGKKGFGTRNHDDVFFLLSWLKWWSINFSLCGLEGVGVIIYLGKNSVTVTYMISFLHLGKILD